MKQKNFIDYPQKKPLEDYHISWREEKVWKNVLGAKREIELRHKEWI